MNLPGRQGGELFELIGGWCNGALDDAGIRASRTSPEGRRRGQAAVP